MVGEDVFQIASSHTKSSGFYKKIHMKTGADQGLGGASLQATSTADLFLLQVSWMLQSKRRSRGGREKEEERL